MPRQVSDQFMRAANAQETGEAFVTLLTIEHSDLPVPIRLTDAGQDITSNGDLYLACPYQIVLPSDVEESPPKAKLSVDNVDRAIVEAVRLMSSSPIIRIDIVLGDSPDVLEASFPDLRLLDVQYDAFTVEGNLGVEALAGEPYPAGRFTPSITPGIF